MSRCYQNFDLIIEPERNGANHCYRVRVDAPTGTSTVDFTVPFSQQDLQHFVRDINPSKAKDFGGQLFKALFTNQVRDAFSSSLYAAKRKGEEHGLRVRLLLTHVPELANIPWEFLYNPGTNRFLSLSAKTPVIRYLDIPEIDPPLKIKRPLRILVMLSSPYNHPQLDIEKEWNNLQEALGPLEKQGLLKLDRLHSATLDALLQQLRQEEYHVFHFIGHGLFDISSQDGYLIFENEHKQAHPVSGQRLGVLLHDEKLRMAVLNACEGGRASSTDSFAGVAPSLVQQGISAVVGMQFAISDKAALTFSRVFYQALSDGDTVDAAVAEARKAMFAQNNQMEWGTPILYLRASEDRVFDIKARDSHVNHDEPSAIEQKAWDTIKMKLAIEQKRADLQVAKREEIDRQRQWGTLYKQGRQHFNEGNWPEALDALLQLRDVTGDYRELAVLIAKVESRTGRQKAIPVRYPARTKIRSSTKPTRRWLPISALVGLFLAALISFAIANLQTEPKSEHSQSTPSTKVAIEPTLKTNVVNIGQKENNNTFPTALPAPEATPATSDLVVYPSATTRKLIQVSAPTKIDVVATVIQVPITPLLDTQTDDSPTATVLVPTEPAVFSAAEVQPTIGKGFPTAGILSPTVTQSPPTATQAPIEPTSVPPTPTQAPIEPASVPPTAAPAPIEPTSVPPTAAPALIEPTSVPTVAILAPIEPTSVPTAAILAPIEPASQPPTATPAPTEPASVPTAVLAENTTP